MNTNQCHHEWLWEHIVYEGGFVHRQCDKCGIHQVGKAGPFRVVEPAEMGPGKKWDLPDLRDDEIEAK